MVRHTAKRGSNAGNQFWGCPQYPECRGAVSVGEADGEPSGRSAQQRNASILLPVKWDSSALHPHFKAEYLMVGSLPGLLPESLKNNEKIRQILGQSVLLSRRKAEADPKESLFECELIAKMLQRGEMPTPTLEIEKVALQTYGLWNEVNDLSDEGRELGWELKEEGRSHQTNPKAILGMLVNDKTPFCLDSVFHYRPESGESLLQSEAEEKFFLEWVPKNLSPQAGHWFIPQASLNRLLESRGHDERGARRVDFLFYHPGGDPFVIEIDGDQHVEQKAVDEARGESLNKIGIETVRVTSHEIARGHGQKLDQIREKCEKALTAFGTEYSTHPKVHFIKDCAIASKVQFAVVRAIQDGFLDGETWNIKLVGVNAVASAGILDVLRLLNGLDTLYGGNLIPSRCTIYGDDGYAATWAIDEKKQWFKETVDDDERDDTDVCIAVEFSASPFHISNQQADFIIRPAYVPVRFSASLGLQTSRKALSPLLHDDAEPALTVFLQNIFRKFQFQPLQARAVLKVLQQDDCIVLLPTGAGKSLIYQLAGLLMPGITVIVDPIIALIEDQVDSLAAYGIDRAASISHADTRSRTASNHLLRRIKQGDYHFIFHTPERLLTPMFIDTLTALRVGTFVNLAVIDEAHCVSEWGHDFRPAYLSLGHNIRKHCRDSNDKPPPILALTGTASRTVLKDMQVDLAIDPESLIRAHSFDRKELTFEIKRVSPGENPEAVLGGVLNTLPRRFNTQEFYNPIGRHTASGIIFCPTVNGLKNGVVKIRDLVRNETGAETTIYSGKQPKGNSGDWDKIKRVNAKKFKNNRAPVLVATKAYGMGIDKPNIRYTVHFGLPGSLEAFYQEAGRAGRDRKHAHCTIIFHEFDSHRSDQLLGNIDLKTLRERFHKHNKTPSEDDVMLAFWFHLNGFNEEEQATQDVEHVLQHAGDLSIAQEFEVPFEKHKERYEKAIYRLFRIGIIDSYKVDFGASKFVIQASPLDLEKSKKKFLDYLEASQPAKAKKWKDDLEEINSDEVTALALTKKLIEFTYDVIERSRRNMILESVRLARQAKSDEEIRDRLLNYLQEGLHMKRIEQLVDDPDINLNDWWELIHKLKTAVDAADLRGLCMRALESYPDHPGLLMARGVVETKCDKPDYHVSTQDIERAITTGIQEYKLQPEQLMETVNKMFDLASSKIPDLVPPLVTALIRLPDELPGVSDLVQECFSRMDEDEFRKHPDIQMARVTHEYRTIVSRLEGITNKMAHRYEMPGIRQTLYGSTE